MRSQTLTNPEIASVLEQVLGWSRDRGYRGHNKHDGLNSPLLRALLGWAKWPRIVAIQSVMRFPTNIRPLLGVPATYNPKGIALFIQALLDRHRTTGKSSYLEEAERLLTLLTSLDSGQNWSGRCWGYPYPWQDIGFFAESHTPNAVVTSFVCEAYLDAFRVTGNSDYLGYVADAIQFFKKDLKVLYEDDNELCLSYMPLSMEMRVMDVSILIGAVIAQYSLLQNDWQHFDMAKRLVTYVVNRQTPEGAWFYTDPPGDSPIRHDNYHTGFILDALWRYMAAVEDHDFAQQYWRGLAFYRQHLFESDGAPRWMSDRSHPYDIHGAAQGILTFSRHAQQYDNFASHIAKWAITNMYDPSGRFFYQKRRFLTYRFTLMRWCNAWMARALSRLLLAHTSGNPLPEAIQRPGNGRAPVPQTTMSPRSSVRTAQ